MPRTSTCLHCGQALTARRPGASPKKYCDNKCQNDWQRAHKLSRGLLGPKPLKRLLIARHGRRCWGCGLSQWRGKNITLELEHADGNSANNDLANLQILCPNCHSQTDTYKAKNRGRGPKSRRKALDGCESGRQ